MMVSRESPTLRQQATDILRQAIISQRFPPGKHLVERELCELLGVSRTSVREALRHLESEDLIKMVPHKGPIVRRLSYAEANDIYQVRAALEGLAGDLFARNASQETINRLEAVAANMAAAVFNPDPDVILRIRTQFYEVLSEGAGNAVCARMSELLLARVCLLGRMSLPGHIENNQMIKEVQDIVDAAKAREPQKMREACAVHVESAARIALPQLREMEQADEAAAQ